MITNRFYITTIIAIFLSLSLGILIGGTLGQQWINDNQQKLISHYQTKAEKMEVKYEEIQKQQQELNGFYQKLKEEYKMLFTNSILHQIDGQKILWINDSNQNFSSLKKTLELAGGMVNDSDKNIDLEHYDVILLFSNNKDNLTNYQWLLQYSVPVIYVTDNEKNNSPSNLGSEIEFYKQKMGIDSLNEHYNFIIFLHNLLQEKQK